MTRAHALAYAVLPAFLSVTLAAGQLAPPAPPAPAGQARDAQGRPVPFDPADYRGSLMGVVVDGTTGQPLEDVRLTISGSAVRGGQSAVSDSDGRFAFVGLGVGSLTLRGSKSGYVSVTYGQVSPSAGRTGTPIELAAGESIRDLKLTLPKGGVITGVVFDERNRPSVGTPVRVMRWSMATGERTLSSAGSATTDDRGVYRVYGLAPGDYIVNAAARTQVGSSSVDTAAMIEAMERLGQVEAAMPAFTVNTSVNVVGGSVTVNGETVELAGRSDPPPSYEGYAPMYYPGTPSLGAAATVTLGVSEERGAVDFGLARVTLARVEGMIIMPSDLNVPSVQVRLLDLNERVPGVSTPSSRAGRDGRFTFSGVPPGRYRAVASASVRATTPTPQQRAENGAVTLTQSDQTTRLWAMAEISVSGAPVSGVVLTLQPGVTVQGRLDYSGAAPRPAPTARVRVTVAPVGPDAGATGASSVTATVGPDGRFLVPGLVPATYRVRTVSGAPGWTLESAMAAGRDTLDFPFEIEPGQPVPELQVTLTDKTSALAGAIQDALGRPTADYTVILFPADSRYWVPQARRTQSTRPTTGGRFSFSGLPAGDYRLAAVTDVESGQWYDPAFLQQLVAASVPVSLAPGQSRTQDLRVAGGQ